MNNYDVTGGSDLKFSDPIRFSATGPDMADITKKLEGVGFKQLMPHDSNMVGKDYHLPVSYLIIQGRPEQPGSYVGKVRSSNGKITEGSLDELKEIVDGILEPHTS